VGVVVVLLNGHVLHVSPEQVQVEVEGSPVIGVGGGNEIRDWDAITDTILNFIANEVLSRLEPFVRG
jgi:predicted ThiF/HesA family dinucleotide-utilizing enzyme